jgi:uncharacterized membrane protein YkoI
MKIMVWRAILISTIAGTLVSAASAKTNSEQLASQARITKARAEQIALARVPRGSIKSAEIEKEKGHLVWSFDIATAGTRNITEILVDAQTGKIISEQKETPRAQAEEAAADRK